MNAYKPTNIEIQIRPTANEMPYVEAAKALYPGAKVHAWSGGPSSASFAIILDNGYPEATGAEQLAVCRAIIEKAHTMPVVVPPVAPPSTTPDATKALIVGDRIRIERGCKPCHVTKGDNAVVTVVNPLGADYSHSVQVAFRFTSGNLYGQAAVFYARHPNRLSDDVIAMNDGNPLHRIDVKRAPR